MDSDAVVETLRARGLVAEDPRFGGRGRPSFLITTPTFLQYFGLTSLRNLPPQVHMVTAKRDVRPQAAALSNASAEQPNMRTRAAVLADLTSE